MRLKYYYAECLDDSNAYSLRARTKREVKDMLALYPPAERKRFGKIRKVTLEVRSNFDLLIECMGEGSGWWEAEQ